MANVITAADFMKVSTYITQLRQSHERVELLFKRLESYGDVIVVGGAIRDIALQTDRPRDIDIILDTEKSELDLSDFVYERNRFGGYKVSTAGIDFDIWCIRETWAFRNTRLHASVDNLERCSFFDLDSLVYSLGSGKGYADRFNKGVRDGEIDIISSDEFVSKNPGRAANVLKALVLRKKTGLCFSERFREYVGHWVNEAEQPVLVLLQEQKRHYGEQSPLSQEELVELLAMST